MTYVCLSYFVRYLDATNISSAYVTGIQEYLGITGSQNVWLTQLFGAACCFSGFIRALILTKVKFSRLLPVMDHLGPALSLYLQGKEF